MEYRVVWAIDVEADSPVRAAMKAKAIQLDYKNYANVFDVAPNDRTGLHTQIDLDEEAECSACGETENLVLCANCGDYMCPECNHEGSC